MQVLRSQDREGHLRVAFFFQPGVVIGTFPKTLVGWVAFAQSTALTGPGLRFLGSGRTPRNSRQVGDTV